MPAHKKPKKKVNKKKFMTTVCFYKIKTPHLYKIKRKMSFKAKILTIIPMIINNHLLEEVLKVKPL